MDIASGSGYPASALSNFAPHPFELDGVQIASMEGFLQSLKFKNVEMQKHICGLTGRRAKFAGKKKTWWRTGRLWWQGSAFDRHGAFYQYLLTRAYKAQAQNEKFRRALLATGDAVLTHRTGKTDPKHTILTQAEFCGRLMSMREQMKANAL